MRQRIIGFYGLAIETTLAKKRRTAVKFYSPFLSFLAAVGFTLQNQATMSLPFGLKRKNNQNDVVVASNFFTGA